MEYDIIERPGETIQEVADEMAADPTKAAVGGMVIGAAVAVAAVKTGAGIARGDDRTTRRPDDE
jgi:hypothetical protein